MSIIACKSALQQNFYLTQNCVTILVFIFLMHIARTRKLCFSEIQLLEASQKIRLAYTHRSVRSPLVQACQLCMVAELGYFTGFEKLPTPSELVCALGRPVRQL